MLCLPWKLSWSRDGPAVASGPSTTPRTLEAPCNARVSLLLTLHDKAGMGTRGPSRIRESRSDSRVIDGIAGRADRADQVRQVAFVARLAQTADMHVDRSQLHIDIAPPDRIQQLLAREDPTRLLQEVTQQAELRGSKIDRKSTRLNSSHVAIS